MILWPLSDVLRKWGGLNQPLYILQLLSPFLAVLYLLRNRALALPIQVVLPCCILVFTTGITALFHGISGYGIAYLGVWFLSLSALIGPSLLVCAVPPALSTEPLLFKRHIPTFAVLLSFLLLINNLLMVWQSFLGPSHILSAGVGGVLDVQISTNTEIQIRAPGLFAFNVSSGLYNIIASVFLVSTIHQIPLSGYLKPLRYLALLSLPVALVRSISRQFLFGLLVVILPLLPQMLRPRVLVRFLMVVLIAWLTSFLLPDLQPMIENGYANFQRRFIEAGGLQQGIIFRFYSTLFSDYAGSDSSLLSSLPSLLDADPLSAIFGYGLGFSSPLFRYVQGAGEVAYGYITLNGKEFLVGETAIPSLLVDVGIINLIVCAWLFVNVIVLFVHKFPPGIWRAQNAVYLSCLMLVLIPYYQVYFRPYTILPSASAFLLPFVLQFLFVNFNLAQRLPGRSAAPHPELRMDRS